MHLETDGSWVYATEEDIRNVLEKVLVFRIRGEIDYPYRDNAYLDRVAVCKPDEPECNN
jgi:hypothetical protein